MRSKLIIVLGTITVISLFMACAAAAEQAAAPAAPQAAAPAAPAQAAAPAAAAAPSAPAQPMAAAAAAPAPVALVQKEVAKEAKATAVPTPVQKAAEQTWMDLYMSGPGYNPAWGEPKKGGIFRYGASHKLAGHDPNYGHSFEGPQFLPTYNALLRYDPWLGLGGQIEGDLAETWEVQDGGLTVLFKLREGINFQVNPNLPAEIASAVSGDSFTCEDAKASLEFALNPPEGILHSGPRAALGHYETSSCIDDYTFKVEFKEALARTLPQFAGMLGSPNNMDKDFVAYIRQEGDHPDLEIPYIDLLDETTPVTFLWGTGTGAFVPTEFEVDVQSKIRANPDYFREGLPLTEGQDQFIITDATARFSALITGQTDYYGEGSASLLPAHVEQINARFKDKFTIMPALHSWGKGIQINMEREPFNDPDIRMAMHLALDRDDWVDFNMAGGVSGVHRHTLWMPPGSIWALPDSELGEMPGWRRGDGKVADIAEANRLVDAALGAGVRFSVECMAQSARIYLDGCEYFQDQMSKNLDVEVTIASVESAVQGTRGREADYDTHYGSKVRTNVADPDDFYMIHLVKDKESWYYRGTGREIADPEMAARLEKLALEQSSELDVAKRVELVHDIERILATEAMYSIPYPWTYIFPAWSNEVKGWQLYPHPSQNKWAQWERMWLDRN